MAVYLLSWDPTKWDWRNIKEQSEQVARGAPLVRQWSCGSNRRIFNGDTVYFVRQGREPRGVFARGEVVRGSYEAMNVDVQDANRGRGTLVIDVRFTALENAVDRVVVPRQSLTGSGLGKFTWDIRESGVKIPADVATALETAWQNATGTAAPAPKPAPAAKAATKGVSEAKTPRAEPVASPEIAASAGAEVPVAKTPAAPAQEKLKAEREARLAKIREREAQERARRESETAVSSASARVEPIPEERRNEVLVQNYFIMLDAELHGELYSKADHRNRIMQELGARDTDEIDLAHRHVSAALAETGLPFSDAFPPKEACPPEIEKAVHVFIEANPDLVEALWIDAVPPASSIPVELDDSRAHWVAAPEQTGFKPTGRSAWHPAGVNEIDYRMRESWNRNLAIAGERFVLAYERARLREAGLKEQVDKVAWQSQTFGDSFGYDIRSLEDDGSERLICVKTTNYGARFPFTLTDSELQRARENPGNFHVYRVFQVSRGARLYVLSGSALLKDSLEPVVFRAWR